MSVVVFCSEKSDLRSHYFGGLNGKRNSLPYSFMSSVVSGLHTCAIPPTPDALESLWSDSCSTLDVCSA
jgi:hypothetical protein